MKETNIFVVFDDIICLLYYMCMSFNRTYLSVTGVSRELLCKLLNYHGHIFFLSVSL